MRHLGLTEISKSNRVPGRLARPHEPAMRSAGQTPGSGMNHRTEPSAVPASLLPRDVSRNVSGDVPGTALAIASLAIVILFGLSTTRLYAYGDSANSYFKRGQAAEAHQDYDTAYEDYQKAFQKNPKDLRYQTAFYRVRVSASAGHISKGRKLLQSGDMQGALAEFLHASEIDPANEEAQQEIAQVRKKEGQAAPPSEMAIPEPAEEQQELAEVGGPAQLKPVSTEPLTLHMIEDAKVVYQAIGKAAGINVLFDPDYNSKRIQVDLNNVSLMDALRIVSTMSNTFWRPVTDNTIFVAQNTRVKRTELDEEAVQTFYLANAWQQNDLNDVQTALRNVLLNAKVYGVQSQNAIVVRGTPDELLLAQKLIRDLDKPRAEVVVDTAVLEVSKNWERTLGIAWPSSIGVQLQSPNSSSSSSSSTTTSSTTTSPTLYDLSHLKASDFAVTVGSATLNLLLTDSNTQILQDPRIRATDGQKADMKIGSKIPIATGSYQTGAATALVSSLVNTQFQYEDVGVEIEVTPSVHYDHDVTLKIKITVSAESGTETISGVTEPIISQRVVDQVIRLREGEASILGGIENNQDTQSWTGIPGLSSIPILKYIFGSKDHTIQNDEIVFVVVPHVVRSQELDQQNLRAIDTGAGQSIDLRHLDNAEPPAFVPGVRPTALEQQAHPAMDTVAAQSAETAAPQALAQMTASQQPNFGPPPMPPGAQAALRPNAPQPAQAPAVPAGSPPPPRAGGAAIFAFNAPTAPLPAGATFQVPVVLNGGSNVASASMVLHYDPGKLALANVASGTFLSADGQAAEVVHRDDGQGNLTIATSRPPGAAGVSGGGVICVLTFQAKSAGQSAISMTNAVVTNSAQQSTQAQGNAQASITIK